MKTTTTHVLEFRSSAGGALEFHPGAGSGRPKPMRLDVNGHNIDRPNSRVIGFSTSAKPGDLYLTHSGFHATPDRAIDGYPVVQESGMIYVLNSAVSRVREGGAA